MRCATSSTWSAGLIDTLPQHVAGEVSKNQLELYTARTPHWEQVSYAYKSNTPHDRLQPQLHAAGGEMGVGKSRRRARRGRRPRSGRVPAAQRGAPGRQARSGDRLAHRDEEAGDSRTGALTYDCFASVEVLEEGAKLFGWDKRNPEARRRRPAASSAAWGSASPSIIRARSPITKASRRSKPSAASSGAPMSRWTRPAA